MPTPLSLESSPGLRPRHPLRRHGGGEGNGGLQRFRRERGRLRQPGGDEEVPRMRVQGDLDSRDDEEHAREWRGGLGSKLGVRTTKLWQASLRLY